MLFRSLYEFAYNFFSNPENIIGQVPLLDAVKEVGGGCMTVTWYRKGEYQIQMAVFPPHHIVPEHTHTNIDSIELLIGGQMCLAVDGAWCFTGDSAFVPVDDYGHGETRYKFCRIYPDTPHGGVTGPSGGVMFSIQHWLNGHTPHCVSQDYNGVAIDDKHMSQIVTGTPRFKKKVTWRDAAPKSRIPPPFEYFHTQ